MMTETLWNRYVEEKDPDAREQLLLLNLPLVHHIARRMVGALRGGVELDDLVGAGTMGLMGAVENFDPDRGLAFSTFAAPRIRGAILDDLRRRDHASRSVRRKERCLASARQALGQAHMRAPSDVEVAGELGIEVERLWDWMQDTEGARTVSLDAPVGQDHEGERGAPRQLPGAAGEEVEEALEREQLVDILQGALLELKEQERVVLSLYYFEEMKLREIAEVLGVTESRVSQVRTKALGVLRERLARLGQAA